LNDSYRVQDIKGHNSFGLYEWRGATHAPLIHSSSSIYNKKIDFKQKGGQGGDEGRIFSISPMNVGLPCILFFIFIPFDPFSRKKKNLKK
jgi:hypothetical protein